MYSTEQVGQGGIPRASRSCSRSRISNIYIYLTYNVYNRAKGIRWRILGALRSCSRYTHTSRLTSQKIDMHLIYTVIQQSKWVKVAHTSSIAELLKIEDHVVGGFPVLHVVEDNSVIIIQNVLLDSRITLSTYMDISGGGGLGDVEEEEEIFC